MQKAEFNVRMRVCCREYLSSVDMQVIGAVFFYGENVTDAHHPSCLMCSLSVAYELTRYTEKPTNIGIDSMLMTSQIGNCYCRCVCVVCDGFVFCQFSIFDVRIDRSDRFGVH